MSPGPAQHEERMMRVLAGSLAAHLLIENLEAHQYNRFRECASMHN